jgi:predicted Fe-Mo cluster-binding NifX family protein
MSVAFLVPDDTQAVIWRGPMKYSVIRQLLADTVWGNLDYLVIDAPPGTGDEPLGVAQLVGTDAGAVIVTTPQQVAVQDVRRCITFCHQVMLPVWGIVENMAGFVCPHCQKKVNLFSNTSGGAELAKQTGLELLGSLLFDPAIADGADAGLSIPECSVTNQTHQQMDQVIQNLISKIQDNQNKKGTETMKIAIPTANGQLCMHFGHCEQFAFVTIDSNNKTVTGTEMLTPPPHEPGVLPKWVAENGGNLVIAGGMGMRAQQLFNQNGVEVLVGASAETPENLATAYLNGTLETGQNVCDH